MCDCAWIKLHLQKQKARNIWVIGCNLLILDLIPSWSFCFSNFQSTVLWSPNTTQMHETETDILGRVLRLITARSFSLSLISFLNFECFDGANVVILRLHTTEYCGKNRKTKRWASWGIQGEVESLNHWLKLLASEFIASRKTGFHLYKTFSFCY